VDAPHQVKPLGAGEPGQIGALTDINDLLERLLALLADELGTSANLEVFAGGRTPPLLVDRPGQLHVGIDGREGRSYGRLWVQRPEDPRSQTKAVELAQVIARMIADRLDRHTRARAVWALRVEEIRTVLDLEELTVVYQPIAALRDGAVVGVEALSRFPGPLDRAPNRWFSDASSVGLATELELAAIRRGLVAFETMPGALYLSLNVSPSTVMTSGLLPLLEGFPLERVVFEITEHAEVMDYASLNAALEPLREAGARIAVDDAGAGFASLRHILQMSPDIIKLDLSLTRGIDRNPVQRALSYSIASFASAIDASVVAEGIETEEELNALRFLGVDFGQGYFLSAPGPLSEADLDTSVFNRSMPA
jgi:EAL domain-containing protein (putative c-di-GMP-specific phosphodiesterase class I)